MSSKGGGPPDGPPDEGYQWLADLYVRWRRVLWSTARELLPCDADADAAVQEVFTHLLAKYPSGPHPHLTSGYFSRAGRNQARSMLRHRRLLVPLSDEMALSLRARGPGPAVLAILHEQRIALASSIENLPPRCRDVMRLVAFDGLTHREIAERLNISLKAVEKQITRGHRLLRNQVGFLSSSEPRRDVSHFGDGGG